MKSEFHKLFKQAKYEIPRRTRYQEVRDTTKYEIPPSTSYHEVRDNRSTTYYELRDTITYEIAQGAQDGPEMVTRWPQDGHKIAQDGL